MHRPFTREPYPKWYKRLPIVIYLPWRNLGCLGFKFFGFYFDIYYRSWGSWFPFGVYSRIRGRRYWVTPWKIRTDR